MGPKLRKEIRELRLAFTCEECANFAPDEGACSLLYPNDVHRREYVEKLQDGDRVWFCKMFEGA